MWNGEALVVFDDGTTANACVADVRLTLTLTLALTLTLTLT